ncbi:hypothetical protein BN2475_510038 [Paraburkholderia ribeironis]|uniref:Uncharacterized protein n=1 Tax=Paraburkholderia ribeironis TaxID=1247936 RepID=A0A1N7SCA2_9BURK|nr:hypothetical protein [Paraburkholderia ribeironis]SIT44962.1 hypothetical protein BN2475_510038 [Paraburkholderia ribeironis]
MLNAVARGDRIASTPARMAEAVASVGSGKAGSQDGTKVCAVHQETTRASDDRSFATKNLDDAHRQLEGLVADKGIDYHRLLATSVDADRSIVNDLARVVHALDQSISDSATSVQKQNFEGVKQAFAKFIVTAVELRKRGGPFCNERNLKYNEFRQKLVSLTRSIGPEKVVRDFREKVVNAAMTDCALGEHSLANPRALMDWHAAYAQQRMSVHAARTSRNATYPGVAIETLVQALCHEAKADQLLRDPRRAEPPEYVLNLSGLKRMMAELPSKLDGVRVAPAVPEYRDASTGTEGPICYPEVHEVDDTCEIVADNQVSRPTLADKEEPRASVPLVASRENARAQSPVSPATGPWMKGADGKRVRVGLNPTVSTTEDTFDRFNWILRLRPTADHANRAQLKRRSLLPEPDEVERPAPVHAEASAKALSTVAYPDRLATTDDLRPQQPQTHARFDHSE